MSSTSNSSSSDDSNDCIIIDDEEEQQTTQVLLEIKPGMKVFALKDKLKHIWLPAILIEIKIPNELYIVKFNEIKKSNENHKQVINEYDEIIEEVEADANKNHLVELESTCVAYAQSGLLNSNDTSIKMKSRVIARYKLNIIQIENNKNLLKTNHMYSGTVAELPIPKNKNRCLIFFDNGYVSYVNENEIFYIFDYETMPIERLSFDHSHFLRSYFVTYRTDGTVVVNLNKKDEIKVYLNKKWRDCKVEQVDCSLVKFDLKLKFLNHNLENNDLIKIQTNIWYFRGSPCILPIYESILNTINNYNDETVQLTSFQKYIMEKNADELNDENRFFSIKLNFYSSTQWPKSAPLSDHLAKETANKNNKNKTSLDHNMKINKEEKSQGQLVNIDIDKIIQYKTKDYTSHDCHILCVFNLEDEIETTKDLNPLLIPMAYGWQRQFCHQSRTQYNTPKKYINYRAPCGRLLRSTLEIDQYLYFTDSKLTIDMYSFDFSVRLNVNFKPDINFIYIPDISRGEEPAPVSCVNSIDNETWDTTNFTYASRQRIRKALEHVPLDTDTKKLEGCNCIDKCRDRSKCSCWRKTFEMTTFADENEINTNVGYRWGRLQQKVSTGIFECNSKCGCDERCSNRVVQNGTKVRLQLFKTLKKGWGVRCLDDIPKGTFISVYSGEIMDEQQSLDRSNEICGDKYFADLNFIDCLDLREKIAQRENLNIPHLQRVTQNAFARKNYRANKTAEIEYIVIDSDEDEQERQTLSPLKSPSQYLNENERRQLLIKEEKTQNIKSLIESNRFFRNFKNSILEWNKPFIMDSSIYGNISKFFNHSCAPNLFYQNVFIDTYDFRFPWIAFFASQSIKAGSELTWDYGYVVDSIQNRIMICYCNSSKCRGRLL